MTGFLTLQNEYIRVKLDFQHGGRIVFLGTVDLESNLLYIPSVNATSSGWQNFGGDFLWIAPQEKWGWPPIPQFDVMPWEKDELLDQFILRSPEYNGIVLSRRFVLEGTSVLVENSIKNTGKESQNWGLWNISQVPLDGLKVRFTKADGIKVFDYPDNVELKRLMAARYLDIDGDLCQINSQIGLDFKIGCVTNVPKVEIVLAGFAWSKKFDIINNNNVEYPHQCNIEFYKNDQYLEAEIVWPMLDMQPGEEKNFRQYFEIGGRNNI